MEQEIAIKIENLSKKYIIGMRKNESFRGSLNALFNRKAYDTSHEFWALKDLNFEIKKGDVVGIIGKNGAGKSTLLKLLSQITRPTEGIIRINGRVASLLEVGTGFHHELTGRENIYLNGTILGMTREEVKSKFDEIVEFSGVEKFIDTPVKHYSSGMYVRLAFAVAAHLEPEILIIDEVLAVGDAEFQKKCLGKMQDVAGQGRTVLFVSHNLGTIASLCTKGILLEQGKVTYIGSTKEAISQYITKNEKSTEFVIDDVKSEIKFTSVSTVDKTLVPKDLFAHSEEVNLKIDIKIEQYIESQSLEICLLKNDGSRIFTINKPINELKQGESDTVSLVFSIPGKLLAANNYSFFVALNSKSCTPAYHFLENICPFTVYDDGTDLSFLEGLEYGVVIVDGKWQIL